MDSTVYKSEPEKHKESDRGLQRERDSRARKIKVEEVETCLGVNGEDTFLDRGKRHMD